MPTSIVSNAVNADTYTIASGDFDGQLGINGVSTPPSPDTTGIVITCPPDLPSAAGLGSATNIFGFVQLRIQTNRKVTLRASGAANFRVPGNAGTTTADVVVENFVNRVITLMVGKNNYTVVGI